MTDVEGPRRGRPRDAGVEGAVLRAFLELVAEHGYVATSMDQVAERAGVAKTTIYRRWPSKHELIVDAHQALVDDTELPDTGSLEGDLRALMISALAKLNDPQEARVMQASIGEMLSNEEFSRVLRDQVLEPRLQLMARIFERAAARGEVSADLDWRTLAQALMGTHIFRIAIMGDPPDAAFSERLLRWVLLAARASEGEESQ